MNHVFELMLFYQDVNEQFEGYTQPYLEANKVTFCCFIRMSMNNLKDIHNTGNANIHPPFVVLSGCQ